MLLPFEGITLVDENENWMRGLFWDIGHLARQYIQIAVIIEIGSLETVAFVHLSNHMFEPFAAFRLSGSLVPGDRIALVLGVSNHDIQATVPVHISDDDLAIVIIPSAVIAGFLCVPFVVKVMPAPASG